MLRVLALAALTMLSSGVKAQVYKCVDAVGKTTYLQSPCPTGAMSTAISRKLAPAPPAAATPADKAGKAAKATEPKTAAELEQDFRKRQQEQAQAQEKERKKLAEAKMREDNCRNSRIQAAALETGVRARINEKGERYVLDDAQFEQELANARKLADQWCR